jgi:hypothetical protein
MALLSSRLGLRPSIDYEAISSAITDGRFTDRQFNSPFLPFIFLSFVPFELFVSFDFRLTVPLWESNGDLDGLFFTSLKAEQ